MLGLFSLFGDPPAYVGPGQPAPAPRPWYGGLFAALFASPPVYVGGGQRGAAPPGAGGLFGLYPEPPRYVAPSPSPGEGGSPPERALPPIPEIERRIWERD